MKTEKTAQQIAEEIINLANPTPISTEEAENIVLAYAYIRLYEKAYAVMERGGLGGTFDALADELEGIEDDAT